MSYTITIEGSTSDPAAETPIIDAVKGALAAFPPDAGLTSAAGVFDVAGTVDLKPAPPPPTLETAEMDLKKAIDALDPADPKTIALQNAYAELLAAIPAPSTAPPTAGDIPAPTADQQAHAEQALAATAPAAL